MSGKIKRSKVTVLLTGLGVVAVIVDVLYDLNLDVVAVVNGAGQHEPVNGYVAVAHKFVVSTGNDVFTVGYVAERLLIATKQKK